MSEISHVITVPTATNKQLGYLCSCGLKFNTQKKADEHTIEEAKLSTVATEAFNEGVAEAEAAEPKPKETEQAKGKLYQSKDGGDWEEVKDAPASITPTKPKATSKVQKFLDDADVRARFENLLDKRAGQFITSLTSLVATNSKLAECTPSTFLAAAVTAAALDLPINPNLGFAYIIPYKNKGVMEAQFQMGYKGFIQLAQRSGQYKTISSTPVYEGQLVDENPMTGNTYDWKAKKSDKIVGYVAYIKLLNGFEKELYMSVEEATSHGKQYSQSFRKGFGLWQDEFDTMARKTVLKLLLSKFGPLSTDIQMSMAIEKDQAVITDPDDSEVHYIDNIGEIQQKIEEAKDAKSLQEILGGLTPEEKVAVQPMVESRLGEL